MFGLDEGDVVALEHDPSEVPSFALFDANFCGFLQYHIHELIESLKRQRKRDKERRGGGEISKMEIRKGGDYRNTALNTEVRVVVKPHLNWSLLLQESENDVLEKGGSEAKRREKKRK